MINIHTMCQTGNMEHGRTPSRVQCAPSIHVQVAVAVAVRAIPWFAATSRAAQSDGGSEETSERSGCGSLAPVAGGELPVSLKRMVMRAPDSSTNDRHWSLRYCGNVAACKSPEVFGQGITEELKL